ncbi:MAG TPA: aspartate/glutamate racemase family protein [Tepidanaerobacter syntrophicus]|uniref:Asp/Glu racemase n=1 Tax=Tepidanaerobacter syntrophicus TaxID=224999 RepID=UPI00174FB8E5|nr:Asp/Glu racemase [Tepidanaerobacter syntrophicus]HHV83726.1 aspartate/glutamate racemase family protein [Tepidanaerobacter syntrophicus]
MTFNLKNYNPPTIGVIAGTPVDTQMGVDFILKNGFRAIGVPTASSPEEQNRLQFLNSDSLTQKVLGIINDFEEKNIFRTMIYCNSLSAAIDVRYIKDACQNSKIVTPLDVYQRLASKYNKIAIWAANGQCLSSIERIFYEVNPSIDIIGISMLPVIKAIESGNDPRSIILEFNLVSLAAKEFASDGLILACTHLPYLQAELLKEVKIPIIDPAVEMLKMLV